MVDNGGEYTNTHYTDMCENLSIEICSIIAVMTWQNSIFEQIHVIIDVCIQTILPDQPKVSLNIAEA